MLEGYALSYPLVPDKRGVVIGLSSVFIYVKLWPS
jgi:hypothetical protein